MGGCLGPTGLALRNSMPGFSLVGWESSDVTSRKLSNFSKLATDVAMLMRLSVSISKLFLISFE